LEPGDIDIEMLLDQAQALIDDAADDFGSSPPDDPAPASDDVFDSTTTAELAPLQPAGRPEMRAEIAEILAAAAADPSVITASPPESQPSADASIAAAPPIETPPEDPPPTEPGTEPAVVADQPEKTAEVPPAQDGAIVVEDFGVSEAPRANDQSTPVAGSPSAESPSPATSQSAAPADVPSQPPPGLAERFLSRVAACVLLFDRPLARRSEEVRRRVGWIALATFLMGSIAWLLPLVRLRGPLHQ